MIRRPPRSTQGVSSAASDVYKRQALDSRTSRDVLNFLKQLNDEGNTIVMITHDNSIAMEARRVVRIADGKITFDGDVKDYAAIL